MKCCNHDVEELARLLGVKFEPVCVNVKFRKQPWYIILRCWPHPYSKDNIVYYVLDGRSNVRVGVGVCGNPCTLEPEKWINTSLLALITNNLLKLSGTVTKR